MVEIYKPNDNKTFDVKDFPLDIEIMWTGSLSSNEKYHLTVNGDLEYEGRVNKTTLKFNSAGKKEIKVFKIPEEMK